MNTASRLGINPSPTRGGVSSGVETFVYPGSRKAGGLTAADVTPEGIAALLARAQGAAGGNRAAAATPTNTDGGLPDFVVGIIGGACGALALVAVVIIIVVVYRRNRPNPWAPSARARAGTVDETSQPLLTDSGRIPTLNRLTPPMSRRAPSSATHIV